MDTPGGGRTTGSLIGRQTERTALEAAAAPLLQGQGGVILISGEAGIGKTHLVESVLAEQPALVLRAPSRESRAAVPYAPLMALLRAGLERSPTVFDAVPCREELTLLLPELAGVPGREATPAGLLDAVRGAVLALARDGPVVALFEDLQWADHATLELLPALAEWCVGHPLLLLGTYRQEELARTHPLRRARQELRRGGVLKELHLDTLTPAATAELLALSLGRPASAPLAALIFGRSEGVPLFVQELGAALMNAGRPASEDEGELELNLTAELPSTLRDAIVVGLDRLPPAAHQAAELASVLGASFDANSLLALIQDDGAFDTLSEYGLITQRDGNAVFRHALIRDAVYAGIPWARRRTLHRQVAAQLEMVGAAPATVADHWLAGQDPERARAALLTAADAACRIYAYRDAASAASRALELWPGGVNDARRIEVLEQLGHCAQTAGLLTEAGLAWREAALAQHDAGDLQGSASSRRRLAGVLELQGRWEQALEARREAADAFETCGAHAAAAEERLAVGTTLRAVSRNTAALAVLARALLDARRAGRRDLEARILAQEGNARARSGFVELGLQVGREGLALAVADQMTSAVVEALQRLADSLEHAGDYLAARAAYSDAFALCKSGGPAAYACRACVTVPLYQNGAWTRAVSECRSVLSAADAPAVPRAVAGAMLGTVLAHWGQPARARPHLLEALSLAQQLGVAPVQMRALWGLALAEDAAGEPQAAAAHLRDLLGVWENVEDHYHILFALRWASSHFAELKADLELRQVVHALGVAADLNGGPVAYSALAHALGELAWLDGNLDGASAQFGTALRLLRDTATPFEEASTRLRAGQVMAARGLSEGATEHLLTAHRAARKLNAARLMEQASQNLEKLGQVVQRGGARTPGGATLALTHRQLEVLRLVAQGHSDKAVAQALRLSPRTVEMHVGHILASLDSRSRTEAVSKAAELGLLNN